MSARRVRVGQRREAHVATRGDDDRVDDPNRDGVLVERLKEGSEKLQGGLRRCGAVLVAHASATVAMAASLGSMPVLTACAPMSPNTASICARTKAAGTGCTFGREETGGAREGSSW